MEDIIYKINEENRIIFVNEEWDKFAIENYGGEVISEKVIGKNLLDFVSNITVKQVYLDLIEEVCKGKEIRINFRCDSPIRKRYLTMTIRCDTPKVVTFISHLLKEEPQIYKNVLDSQVSRTNEFIRMCSWCKKVEYNTEWLELDKAINTSEMFLKEHVPMLTHTICGDCLKNILIQETSPKKL